MYVGPVTIQWSNGEDEFIGDVVVLQSDDRHTLSVLENWEPGSWALTNYRLHGARSVSYESYYTEPKNPPGDAN